MKLTYFALYGNLLFSIVLVYLETKDVQERFEVSNVQMLMLPLKDWIKVYQFVKRNGWRCKKGEIVY